MISLDAALYVTLFLGVLLLGQSLYLSLFDRSGKRAARVNERFDRLSRKAVPESEVLTLRRRRRAKPKGFEAIPLLGPIVAKAGAAGVKLHPVALLTFLTAIGGVLFLFLIGLFKMPAPLAGGMAAFMAIAGARLWLNGKIEARRTRFEEQLPDALELIARSLKLGQSFNAGVAMVAREAPEPTRSEFRTLITEVDYGVSMPEALDRMADRLDSQHLRFLTVVVSIQTQSGGSLSEVLLNLSGMVRARFRMFNKIRAITADGRLSGWLLSAFPIAAIFGVQAVRPTYFETVSQLPQFPIVAAMTILLLVLNILFMRAIVNVKV